MNAIFILTIFGVALFSTIVYFRSPGNALIRLIKGLFSFILCVRCIETYNRGDYLTALIIVSVIFCLSYRRRLLNRQSARYPTYVKIKKPQRLHSLPCARPASVITKKERLPTLLFIYIQSHPVAHPCGIRVLHLRHNKSFDGFHCHKGAAAVYIGALVIALFGIFT